MPMSITALLVLLLSQCHRSWSKSVSGYELDANVESPLTLRRTTSSSNSSRKKQQPTCLVCDVTVADIQYEVNKTGDVDDFLVCMTAGKQEPDGSSNQVYRLDQLPKAFIRQYRQQLYSGKYKICIPKGRASRVFNQVVIPSNTTKVQLLPPESNSHRELVSKTGDHTVLVVRVTSVAGEDPGLTADQLQGSIFGSGPIPQSASLVSQYGACSLGKLTMRPATGNTVVNGVIEIQYPGQIAGGNIVGSLQTALLQQTKSQLGISDLSQAATHIMFCLPSGSEVSPGNSKWIAFSYLNKWLSFFQNGWCQKLSAQVHEIGHQIGFRHSGIGKYQYGDFSCMMGASFGVVGRPQMCFNGHKNWYSGWFEQSKVAVNPIANGAWVGNIVAFVDVPQMSQVPNAVSIVNAGDLFIEFNSAKKYNYQVVANGNRVTVVQNNATSPWSNLLVGLSSGQNYTYANFSGTGIALIIQICSVRVGIVNYAKVSIFLKDGIQTSKCGAPLTLGPTYLPTPPPTPTRSPTGGPTISPTPDPTPPPTVEPTVSPTPEPTTYPTTISLPPTVRELNLTAPIVIEYPKGYCFSEANTVVVHNKGTISIKDLRIGDFIESSDGELDRVYSFGHYKRNTEAEYLQIRLRGNSQPLEISKDHLLFVNGMTVAASEVAVGDRISTGDGGTARVLAIHKVSRVGAFAPFTVSGTIVVSGVLASNYVTLQEHSHLLRVSGYRTPISMHWLAHVFQSPHRLVCLINVAYCNAESYTTEGISKWVEGPLHVSQWLLKQNGFVLTIVVTPALVLAYAAYLVEVASSGNQTLRLVFWCLGVTFAVMLFRQQRSRKGSRSFERQSICPIHHPS